jgi:hypothetical protein
VSLALKKGCKGYITCMESYPDGILARIMDKKFLPPIAGFPDPAQDMWRLEAKIHCVKKQKPSSARFNIVLENASMNQKELRAYRGIEETDGRTTSSGKRIPAPARSAGVQNSRYTA